MGTLGGDIRIALRALLRARGFTVTGVLTLALAIALNTAVLAVVSAYLFTSLPYPEAKRLHNIRYAAPDRRPPAGLTSLDWSSLDDVIEHPIAWDLDMFYLVGGDHPEQAPGAWVTPGFMEGLGIRVARGRTFSPSDFQTGSPQVALISHPLWDGRFGRDPRILGHRFNAYVSDRPDEAETFTIVGVLPQNFWHVNPYTEILAPLRAASYPYMARLREGVPSSVVEQRVTDLVKAGAKAVPPDWRARVTPVHGDYVTRVKPILLGVAAAAALVLLIACANVTLLVLIRATRREREVALRLALGSSRGRLARLLAAEGLVLAGAATAGGLLVSALVIRSLAPVVERQIGRPAPGGASAIGLDATSFGIAIACCAATAMIFALAPLVMSWRADLARAMQARTPGGADTKGRRRARSALVAVEVAASLALVVGCGLLAQTVIQMVSVDLGYRSERLIAGSVGLRERSYPDTRARLLFYDRLLTEFSGVSSVDALALANWPVVASPQRQSIEAEAPDATGTIASSVIGVGPGYFAALGIRRLDGREFTAADRSGAEPVAIVSETLARRLRPDGHAVGARVRLAGREGAERAPTTSWRTVVGVVSDVRQSHVDEDLADLYIPFLETAGRFASIYTRLAPSSTTSATGLVASALSRSRRSASNSVAWADARRKVSEPTSVEAAAAALRRAMARIAPEVALQILGPVDDLIDRELARPRFLAGLLAAFAASAVPLALIGVYGVTAYAIKQREHEVAVRVAVGARPRDVTRLFLLHGIPVLALGLAAGVYGATIIGRLFESQLVKVTPADPMTLGTAAAALAAAGAVAVWWPAHRAARIDPARALREE